MISLRVLLAGLVCRAERLKDPTDSGNVQTDEPRNTRECDSDFNGELDLIYTWWSNVKQTKTIHEVIDEATKHFEASPASSSFLEAASASRLGLGLQQQRELTYNLRGAEKYGLLAHVRFVHILIADTTFDKFGAPVDLNYTDPRIRLVSTSKMGITLGGKNPDGGLMMKMASLLRIPDLHCWALLLNDDVFPTRQFDVSALWNAQTKKQIKYRLDTYSWGFCDGHQTTTCHGPFFFSTCHMGKVVAKYQSWFDELRTKGQDPGTTADVICLYDNMALIEGWAEEMTDYKKKNEYLMICHTNGGCTEEEFTNTEAMFTNIQGNFMSDEYKGGDKVPQTTLKWFGTRFNKPSAFEIPRGATKVQVELDRTANEELASTCPMRGGGEGAGVSGREAEAEVTAPRPRAEASGRPRTRPLEPAGRRPLIKLSALQRAKKRAGA